MNCPKCKIEMKEGVALPTPIRLGCFPDIKNVEGEEVKLEKCLKCPECGYSDDGLEWAEYYERVNK